MAGERCADRPKPGDRSARAGAGPERGRSGAGADLLQPAQSPRESYPAGADSVPPAQTPLALHRPRPVCASRPGPVAGLCELATAEATGWLRLRPVTWPTPGGRVVGVAVGSAGVNGGRVGDSKWVTVGEAVHQVGVGDERPAEGHRVGHPALDGGVRAVPGEADVDDQCALVGGAVPAE